MTDPLDALREPVRPADPDPDFATGLRERLRRAVLGVGGEMTTTETTTKPGRIGALTPYLVVSDARRALDFYVEVFDAARRGDPIVMPDGRIGHAELAIGDAVLMLADEHPEIGVVVAPEGGAQIRIELSGVDDSVRRAVARGAELLRPVEDSGYGRGGTIKDPFGQRWLVAEKSPEPPVPQGHAMYFTFQVPADEPAKTFYGGVLGWRYTAGSTPTAWGVEGHGLQGGLWGGPGRQVGWKLMYAVDDLEAALERVREFGGRPGEVEQHPYGRTADCVDNQGIEFWLWQS
ncbi:MAG TPA: VOC family protein [Amycolatopsis sp.]|nr:VOC family protein [Amycolatopsis sp.]